MCKEENRKKMNLSCSSWCHCEILCLGICMPLSPESLKRPTNLHPIKVSSGNSIRKCWNCWVPSRPRACLFLEGCSPPLLAEGWGASEPVDVCESWWWFTKTAFCSLGSMWGSREGEHQAHLHLLFTEGYFITNGLRYPAFSFSGLHEYYQFFHLYLRLLAKQSALAVV